MEEVFFSPCSIVEMTSQREKTVCWSAGTCCAMSASHMLQHSAIKTEVTKGSQTGSFPLSNLNVMLKCK